MTNYKIGFNVPKSQLETGYIASVVVEEGELESLPPKKVCTATVLANSPDDAKRIIQQSFPGCYITICI
jgi:hypothetical protein